MAVFGYIGASVLLVLLISFTTVALRWSSKRVSKMIQDNTLDLISSYDEVLNLKSHELALVEAELEDKRSQLALLEEERARAGRSADAQAACPADNGASLVRAALRNSQNSYVDTSLGESYRKVKDSFSFSQGDVANMVPPSQGAVRPGPATRLLEELSSETVFQLSTLGSEQQLEMLRDVGNEEVSALLDGYCGMNRRFDVIGFYDYLKAVSATEPHLARVYVGEDRRDLKVRGAEVLLDEGICEGFQIEKDGVMYDYALHTREVS